jgi:hypothetical protein
MRACLLQHVLAAMMLGLGPLQLPCCSWQRNCMNCVLTVAIHLQQSDAVQLYSSAACLHNVTCSLLILFPCSSFCFNWLLLPLCCCCCCRPTGHSWLSRNWRGHLQHRGP